MADQHGWAQAFKGGSNAQPPGDATSTATTNLRKRGVSAAGSLDHKPRPRSGRKEWVRRHLKGGKPPQGG